MTFCGGQRDAGGATDIGVKLSSPCNTVHSTAWLACGRTVALAPLISPAAKLSIDIPKAFVQPTDTMHRPPVLVHFEDAKAVNRNLFRWKANAIQHDTKISENVCFHLPDEDGQLFTRHTE